MPEPRSRSKVKTLKLKGQTERITEINNKKMERIASLLNYKREFLSPGKIRVHIPNAPSDDAEACVGTLMLSENFRMQSDEYRLYNWIDLFNLSLFFALYGSQDSKNDTKSYIDGKTLLQDGLVFASKIRLTFAKGFEFERNFKYPLFVDISLNSFQKSKYETKHSLFASGGSTQPLMTITAETYYIDPKTLKTKPFPKWWIDKYGCHCEKAILPNMPDIVANSNAKKFVCKIQVTKDNVDFNEHWSWISFILFCYKLCIRGVTELGFRKVTMATIKEGIETVYLKYKNEARLGDELEVHFWEDDLQTNSVYFQFRKKEKLCCEAKLSFHNIYSKL